MKHEIDDLIVNIEQIVLHLGYECVNVALKNDSGRLKLQVLIDSIGGINVEDCERVSKNINAFLDKNDDLFSVNLPDKTRYYLEVSSPGIERPLFKLTDYERFSGSEARIKIDGLIDGRKTFTGKLCGVNENNVLIQTIEQKPGQKSGQNNESLKKIPFEKIRSGNLLFKFDFEDKNKNNKTNKTNKNNKANKTNKKANSKSQEDF